MPTPRPIPTLVCLLAGVALSVSGAWGIATADDMGRLGGWRVVHERNNPPGRVIEAFDPGIPMPDDYPRATWLRRTDGFGRVVYRAMGSEGWTPGEVMPETRPETAQRSWAGERQRFGWPMVAMERRTFSAFTIPGRDESDAGALASPLGGVERGVAVGAVRLPVLPAWPGLAVNMLVYAGVCWVVVFAPGEARRWRRRRAGRCAACGYDTRGLASCPECGARTFGKQASNVSKGLRMPEARANSH